ncbi:MAG: hypothetical protein AAF762_12060 [Pseudomonadota bacterium]
MRAFITCLSLSILAVAPAHAATVGSYVITAVQGGAVPGDEGISSLQFDRNEIGAATTASTSDSFTSPGGQTASGEAMASADASTGTLQVFGDSSSFDSVVAQATAGSAIREVVTLSGSGVFEATMAVDAIWDVSAGVPAAWSLLIGSVFIRDLNSGATAGLEDVIFFGDTAIGGSPPYLVAAGVADGTFTTDSGSIDDFIISASFAYSAPTMVEVTWGLVVETLTFGDGSSAFLDSTQTGTIFAEVDGADAGLWFETDGFLENAVYPVDVGLIAPPPTPAPIPMPATALLLASGLGFLAFTRRRRAL